MVRNRKLSVEKLDPIRGCQRAAVYPRRTRPLFDQAVTLRPKERRLIRTGLAVAIPAGYYGRLAPRSGLATQKCIDVLAGVIDATIVAKIGCLLYKPGNELIELPAHTKSASDNRENNYTTRYGLIAYLRQAAQRGIWFQWIAEFVRFTSYGNRSERLRKV